MGIFVGTGIIFVGTGISARRYGNIRTSVREYPHVGTGILYQAITNYINSLSSVFLGVTLL